ncbi:MAG: tRNA (guanosine(46)-N7)-methyltransferase TrmB [Clostridia bacterium]|nr:tRNA (guanosine(46)-N7)-methyltransferase TrmB [Clostridia bacterium]
MRIRRKKWAREELDNFKYYIHEPEVNKGKWRKLFKNDAPIHIELGCGKGLFISSLASNNRNINYIAVDMIEAMLGLAKRNIEKMYEGTEIDNLYLINANVDYISKVFSKEDGIERIYINFCNPWPRGKHNKRRLTHTRKLNDYKEFLKEGGEIYFKTDNDELFEDSLVYFEETGFKILKKTYDLHNESIFENNIVTEHEKMFSDEGIKIKALIAKL